jgi:tagatose 1,6-diphosphate aldolase
MRPGKLRGLQRLAGPTGRFEILAIDQRPPLIDLAEQRGVADVTRGVVSIKAAVIAQLQANATATLVDPMTALALFDRLAPHRGLLLTLEDHRYRDGPGGRRSHTIDGWSVERIKSTGADAVKLLAWYRPDAHAAIRRHQQRLVEAVGRSCVEHDIPFIFELLVYPFAGDRGRVPGERRSALVLDSLADFTDPRFAVDIFKVECPADDEVDATQLGALFREVDAIVRRPWVVLSGGADRVRFLEVVRSACAAGASGYLAGRSIWWNAVNQFPDTDAMERLLREDAAGFMQTLHGVVEDHAPPWPDQCRDLGHPRVLDDVPTDPGPRSVLSRW